ncbi:hypothetical protein BD779DRAFT_1670368 [Infundibulicybe gibba]|nr:hypothetical protein BD779DRAFT_1670368 [Infundibulicybe gibba]
MAYSHSLKFNSRKTYEPFAPSSSIQMPNVFVVPPEEEQSPTWCYFDAGISPPNLSTVPDAEELKDALQMLKQTESPPPLFHRSSAGELGSVIMPRKSCEGRSIADVLMHEATQDPQRPQEVSSRAPTPTAESGNDSEIVEVVKVGRHGQAEPAPVPDMKRSKTFKSRASKAFRSIKNVGKSSSRSKPRAQDIFPPNGGQSTHSTIGPGQSRHIASGSERTPNKSRRSSVVLSQIFHAPTLKTKPSIETPLAPPSESHFPDLLNHTEPETHISQPSGTQQDDMDDMRRSSSPTPSTQTFSAHRRFSMLSLQRIFSFSQIPEPPNPSNDSIHSGSTTPRSTPSMSHDSSGPSTVSSSSSGPETPIDEAHMVPARPRISMDLDVSGMAVETWGFGLEPRLDMPDPKQRAPLPALEEQDMSLEMRLDSLHFDSLSFDADNFNF